MSEYRRAYVPGGTYFFTLVTANRIPILTTDLARRCLRHAFVTARRRWPFDLTAVVLLPDHLHAVWTLPHGDYAYSRRWALIKREFTRNWISEGGRETRVTSSKHAERRRGVWQRRFWEHAIRDEIDLKHHCDYIHYNPVKHELARCPKDWAYSSFLRFVSNGDYDPDWGCANSPPIRFDGLNATAME